MPVTTNDGLRALAVLTIVCTGTALQNPPANASAAELHSIEGLCGASHVNSSITYNVDDEAWNQLRTITPFNTDFPCPAQIFLRHAQDHTEPPTGSPIPEYVAPSLRGVRAEPF